MRGEAAFSTTYSEMSERAVKRRKMYVDHMKDKLKLTYLVHDHVHSSDAYKVLGDFGTKCAKVGPNKYLGQEPTI